MDLDSTPGTSELIDWRKQMNQKKKNKEEFKKERQKPYEEVKDDVAYEAEEKLRSDLTKAWLGKLKDQASVKIFGDRIELPKTEETEKMESAGEGTSDEVENVPSNEPAKE